MTEEKETELRRRHPWWNVPCEHRDGWFDLLDRFAASVDAHGGPAPELLQVKQKFGELRVYLRGDDVVRQLAEEATKASRTTCEECGKPGTLRWGPRVRTRCPEHLVEDE